MATGHVCPNWVQAEYDYIVCLVFDKQKCLLKIGNDWLHTTSFLFSKPKPSLISVSLPLNTKPNNYV